MRRQLYDGSCVPLKMCFCILKDVSKILLPHVERAVSAVGDFLIPLFRNRVCVTNIQFIRIRPPAFLRFIEDHTSTYITRKIGVIDSNSTDVTGVLVCIG